MAIYPIDFTSSTTVVTSLRAGLNSAGILTTNHRETSTNLIVTTTRSSRVLRFLVSTGLRIFTYYGTSYVSGDTIADAVTVQAAGVGSGAGASAALIVTADVLGLFEFRGTAVAGWLCGNLNDLAATPIIWGWAQGNSASLFHRTDSMVQVQAAFYRRQIISADEKYLMSEIPCTSGIDGFLSLGVQGVKALHKSANQLSPFEIVGDDVIVPTGGANGESEYMGNMSLYIPNGNSWSP